MTGRPRGAIDRPLCFNPGCTSCVGKDAGAPGMATTGCSLAGSSSSHCAGVMPYVTLFSPTNVTPKPSQKALKGLPWVRGRRRQERLRDMRRQRAAPLRCTPALPHLCCARLARARLLCAKLVAVDVALVRRPECGRHRGHERLHVNRIVVIAQVAGVKRRARRWGRETATINGHAEGWRRGTGRGCQRRDARH